MSAQSRGKYPPTPATNRQRQSVRYMRWGWTRSLHRIRPATAGCRPGSPRSHTQSAVSQEPDATEAADQAWSAAIRPSDGAG